MRPRVHSAGALVGLMAALLLGLTACTAGQDPAGDGPADPTTTEQAPEEETTDAEDAEATTADEQDPDGAATGEDPGTPEGATGSPEGRAIVFVHAVDPDRLGEQDGETRLPADELAALAQDMAGAGEPVPSGADPATCESDLRYVAGADVGCTVTAGFDGSSQEMTLYAHPIAVPGGGHGVLYTAEEPMTEDARWATFNGDNQATAIGMGGAYGMDPVPAPQLVADMQTVIDFDFTRDPVDTSQWTYTVQQCAGELDFERLVPVRCTATNDVTGADHTAWALPGTFYGKEPGLVVSIETQPAT